LHVPRHFNFCTVLDKWAAVEKVFHFMSS
jgi:hypothetical protein